MFYFITLYVSYSCRPILSLNNFSCFIAKFVTLSVLCQILQSKLTHEYYNSINSQLLDGIYFGTFFST